MLNPKSRRFAARLALGLSLLTSVAASGCMETRPPVNRVQPNAVEKSLFVGDWYYQQTVIDSPYSAGFTFVGQQGKLEKIRWEIQEDFLIGRRAYQYIQGSEPVGISGSADQENAPVAIYKISSHFDVRRQYNTVTGEEMNVIEENTTDRPWYERSFMRIDWSQNLSTNTDIFGVSSVIGEFRTTPVAYFVQDPNDDNRTRFESDANGNVNYLDVVNKVYAEPESVDIPGYGPIPVCLLRYQDHLDCAAAEVTIRNSFLKVEDRDYQPLIYTGDRMDRAGYFLTERTHHNPQYGITEPERYRYAARHNIWQQSHVREGNGLKRCFENADCAGGGSTCDLDWARAHEAFAVDQTGDQALYGACTIPYRERQIRPIVYYGVNLPEDFYPNFQEIARGWNSKFSDTVSSLRELECLDAGGSTAECTAERAEREIYVACHSPVIDGDSAACGPKGTVARPGDLRHSIVGWVNDAHLSSPLGYGPSSADPLTGEVIMGNAFIYGDAMESISAFGRDIVQLINEPNRVTAITEGVPAADWAKRFSDLSSAQARTADTHVIGIDSQNMAEFGGAMNFSWAQGVRNPAAGAANAGGTALQRAFAVEREVSGIRGALYAQGAIGNGVDRGNAMLQRIRGTDIEQMLVTPESMMAAGFDPQSTRAIDVLDQASPLRALHPAGLRAVQSVRNQLNAQSCVLNADFADEGLLGLAREIKRVVQSSNPVMTFYGVEYNLGSAGAVDYDKVRLALRQPIFNGLAAHEIGHTLGLRHNFDGSNDALNFGPEYWRLRNDGTMGPRLSDPITQTELDGRIMEHQVSTVMDYGNNFVIQDHHGPGHYDGMAIKLGYGDLVEAFADAPTDTDNAEYQNYQRSFPLPFDISTFMGANAPLKSFHYTDWPAVLGGVDKIENRVDVRFTSTQDRSFQTNRLLPHRSGADTNLNVMDLVAATRPGTDGSLTVVPYRFGSDEQADIDTVGTVRYDIGPDPYEATQSVIDNYWNYYVFNNFRRNRVGFNPGNAINRTYGRYFDKLKGTGQVYALYRAGYETSTLATRDSNNDGTPDWENFWQTSGTAGTFTAAAAATFNLFTRVLAAPEPGPYSATTLADGSAAMQPSDSGNLNVNFFAGRALSTTWDQERAGYFWFDQVSRVGYTYDKLLAIISLADPTTYFLGKDTDEDVRRYAINYASIFPEAVYSMFRGTLGEDWSTIAPRFNEAGEVVFPNPTQLKDRNMPLTYTAPLLPNISFTAQMYASLFGMAYLPQTYNQDYLNQARIFALGANEEINLGARPTVTFVDSNSGITYVAGSYVVGGRETGAGAQMLLHAQALATQAAGNGPNKIEAAARLRSYVDNINLMRRMSSIFGGGAQPL